MNIQSFINGRQHEYSIAVPGCESDSFKDIKISLTGVTLYWETESKSSPLNWTLNFCKSAPISGDSTEASSE